MSSSVRPHRWQPTRRPRPRDSPGKNTGVDCHFLLQCVKVKLLSCVQLLATPWTAAYQAPPSMGFSRQDYWSGVPLPSLNMLSRFVMAFLLRSKCLSFMLQSPSALILEPPKIKSVTVSIVSPSICHESDGTGCHDLRVLFFFLILVFEC